MNLILLGAWFAGTPLARTRPSEFTTGGQAHVLVLEEVKTRMDSVRLCAAAPRSLDEHLLPSNFQGWFVGRF